MVDLLKGCTPGQIEAISRKHRPGFIMAGAGTGKTLTLSRRIGFQMGDDETPLDPERLMAITFTEAAASELLDRARRAAEQSGIEEAYKIEASWISTIHSMCRRMLSENALDADLDPGLVLMTEAQTAEAMASSVEQAVADADPAKAARVVDALGGRYSRFADMVAQIVIAATRNPGGAATIDFGPYSVPQLPAVLSQATECIRDAIAVYEEAAEIKKGKTKDTLANDIECLDRLLHWTLDVELLEQAVQKGEMDAFKLASRVGEVKDAKATAMQYRDAIMFACKMDQDLELVPFIQQTAMAAERNMRSFIQEQSKLTFDALLEMCHEMLQDADLAATYSAQFDSIMIDEFQDTDPLQASIVKSLCSDEREFSKLVCVGDRQQSIYGFRGADVSVSDDMQQDMQAQDAEAVIPLDINFRSHPDILSFVGSVFSADDFFGDAFLNLKPASSNADFALRSDKTTNTPSIEIMVTQTPTKGIASRNSVYEEAAAVAKRFKELKEADPNSSYDDMAILLRSFTNVDVYMEALRNENIPSAITGGRRFYSFTEVSAAVDLLRMLAGDSSDMLLFRILASEIFRTSDHDLALLKQLYNRVNPAGIEEKTLLWDVCAGYRDELPDSVNEAVKMMARARKELVTRPVSKIFAEAVCASGWEETMYLDPMTYAGKVANIQKLVDMLEELEVQYGLDYASVIDEISYAADAAEAFGGKDNATLPGRTVGKGQPGCVSIMTIHASKGLEFPIVALIRAEASSKGFGHAMISTVRDGDKRRMMAAIDLWDKSGDALSKELAKLDFDEIDSKLIAPTTYADYIGAMYAKKSKEEDAESRRLVYVGMTRAKSKLIYVAGLKEKKDGSLASNEGIFQQAFQDAMGGSPDTFGDGVLETAEGVRVLFRKIEVPDEMRDYPHEIEYARASGHAMSFPEYGYTMSETRGYSAISFTSVFHGVTLNSKARLLLGSYDTTQILGTTTNRDSDTATKFGDLFHECARRMVLTGRTPEMDVIERISASIEVEEENAIEEASRLLHEMRQSKIWDDITAATMYVPEMPLSYSLGGQLVAGFIDVYTLKEGAAVIYDYKTGLGNKTAQDVMEDYGYQALLYAAGVLGDDSVDSVQVSFVLVENDMAEIRTPVWTTADLEQMFEALRR